MILITILGCGAFLILIIGLVEEKKAERYKLKKELLLKEYPELKRKIALEELFTNNP